MPHPLLVVGVGLGLALCCVVCCGMTGAAVAVGCLPAMRTQLTD
jgi:hypothetical protein